MISSKKKLTKLQKIIAKVEASYVSKKKSLIWSIWNNLYDLERKLQNTIKNEAWKKTTKKWTKNDWYQHSLIVNNID